LLLAITAIWGSTFVVVKQATSQIDVLWFLCLRFSLAASIMLPFVRRVSIDPTRSPFRPEVTVPGVGIGLVLAGSYLMQTFGLQYVEATISGLITGLFVVLGPVLNRLIFGVGIRPLHWCAVMASVLGLCLLTGATPQYFGLGEWLTLGCAGALGLHVCLLDRFASKTEPFTLATLQITTAAVVFALALLVGQIVGWTEFRWPTLSTWGAILLTSVLATAVGYSVQTKVQQHLSAVRVAVILAMEPVFAAIVGRIAGDRLGFVQLLGGAIMLAAMLLVEFGPKLFRGKEPSKQG
jgi:drug/metabolite transporter (DMT)-like permease